MIGYPGSSAARRMPADMADPEDDDGSPASGGHWVVALAAVAAIAWITFIVLLALFVTTATAST